MARRFRIVTYNVHKCRGLDGRVRPSRVAEVLRELRADIIALQEVVSLEESSRERNQLRFVAESLGGMYYVMGENRRLRGAAYGNALLSRFPIVTARNYDITHLEHEERGCLRADIAMQNDCLLHVFNVHLGTAYAERRHQGRKLVTGELLNDVELSAPRIVLGDFNEWTRGLATHLLSSHLESADIRIHLQTSRTYPGLLPVLHLDHIYYDRALELECLTLHRTRRSLVASDHLPLVADFRFPGCGKKKNGSK